MTVLDRAAQTQEAQNLVAQQRAKEAQLAQIGAQVLKQQEQVKQAQMLDEAHTMGIDDGLAAMSKRLDARAAYENAGKQYAEQAMLNDPRMYDAPEIPRGYTESTNRGLAARAAESQYAQSGPTLGHMYNSIER